MPRRVLRRHLGALAVPVHPLRAQPRRISAAGAPRLPPLAAELLPPLHSVHPDLISFFFFLFSLQVAFPFVCSPSIWKYGSTGRASAPCLSTNPPGRGAPRRRRLPALRIPGAGGQARLAEVPWGVVGLGSPG